MKYVYFIFLIVSLASCNSSNSQKQKEEKQVEILKPNNTIAIVDVQLENDQLKKYNFLNCMYEDSYFPKFLVDKCKNILLNLCKTIETKKPINLEELYKITHASTIEINNLQEEFYKNDSEIETAARDCIGLDFEIIAKAYGFDPDIEELIAPREW